MGALYDDRLRRAYELAKAAWDAHEAHLMPTATHPDHNRCKVNTHCDVLGNALYAVWDGLFPESDAPALLKDTPDAWDWWSELGGASVADYVVGSFQSDAAARIYGEDPHYCGGPMDPFA